MKKLMFEKNSPIIGFQLLLQIKVQNIDAFNYFVENDSYN